MDIDAVISEVARRHKIRLAADDPILATVTAIEVVHQQFADNLKTLITEVANQATDRLVAQIETGRREVAAGSDHAKRLASNIINEAGTWSAARLKEASDNAVFDIEAAVQRGLSSVAAETSAARSARRVATWSAAVAVALCLVILGAAFGFWLGGQ